ncbi:MAG: substrate-binding domain-containing protein [Rhodospirillales bacterium]|nr:substrate-binding domain-containing protein [Rhodospirillales bacterium]
MPRILRPTLRDIAREARVSIATVSRALSRPALVESGTRAEIERTARRLGYLPDGVGRALASGSSRTAGVIVPTLDAAIFSRAIQALQRRLAEAGYQLLVAAHDYSLAAEASAVRAMLGHRVDALLLVGADRSEETRRLLEAALVPVLITWSFDSAFDCIGFDNEEAGRLAALHLLALGHRRIGMISGLTEQNDRARLRRAGVARALAAAGLPLPDWRVVEQPFSLAGGRAALAELLALTDPPSAIVCGNDLLAAGALFEAQARGIPVPEQLSLVGIDNLEIAAHLSPPLTTVHLPTAQLGVLAAEHVLARLSGEAVPVRRELPVALVERGSTAPPAPA